MGGKAPMQAPPPIDNSVMEKTNAAEAKVEAEKGKMLATKKKRPIRNNLNKW
jgi:hypothetical protein